jgi:septal ring factor EnvC (AmiA/AmiB activator)
MDTKDYLTLALGTASFMQTGFLFFKGRRDRDKEALRDAMQSEIDSLGNKLTAHEKGDREMHDRVKAAETRIEGMQQQISESRERHGELVQRIDQIHQTMLTKDDLKMLFEVIKAGGSK